MENKIVYPNMNVFFREMKKLINETPNKKWDAWEAPRLLQLGFEREDGLIIACRMSSLRKHYKIRLFSSQTEGIKQYKQDIQDLFDIKNRSD